jgi:hypothetical protein
MVLARNLGRKEQKKQKIKKIWGAHDIWGRARNLGGAQEIWRAHKKFGGHEKYGGAREIWKVHEKYGER